MTTSGTTAYSTNGSQIITDAYLTCGAIDIESDPSAAQYQFALRMLNRMVKQWQTRNVALHFFQDLTIPLVDGKQLYVLGPSQTAPNIAIPRPMRIVSANRKTYTAFGTSTDTVTPAVGSQAFTVAASLAFVAGQVVNIDTPTGNSASGTVTTYTGTTLTINITSVANATAASYWLIYTNDSYINETEITMISREDYGRLNAKNNPGIVTQAYYDRQSTLGNLYVWPQPSDSLSTLVPTIERQVEIFVDDGDTPDFPVESELALVYGLAAILCDSLTLPLQEKADIKSKATDYFNQMLMTDQENVSFFFQPDMRYRR